GAEIGGADNKLIDRIREYGAVQAIRPLDARIAVRPGCSIVPSGPILVGANPCDGSAAATRPAIAAESWIASAAPFTTTDVDGYAARESWRVKRPDSSGAAIAA